MKKIIFCAASILIFAGCYNDKYDKLYPQPATTTCDTNTTISYANNIEPIIVANCYDPSAGNCHNATGSSGYNYQTSITALQANALNGSLVTDINFMPTRGHNSMPFNGTQLSACDIDMITRWVNEGAPNN